ncbi:MAG: hypothetical protein EKK61_02685 [Rickettsiales bacterium]|nr:MAG: hypothetical protein EKK61_02685 [Rickettsiales bacterium]
MSSINIEYNLKIENFVKIISYNFSKDLDNNLSLKLILSISNLISLDYIHRLKEQGEIHQHAEICSSRVKKHLGYQVIMQEDFSTAMSLFIIAITPENKKEEANVNLQNIDIIIETIISKYYSDSELDEIKNIRSSLKNLLNMIDSNRLIDYINNTPEIFQLTVKSAIKNKQTLPQLSAIVQTQIQNTIIRKNKINKKINVLQSLFTKITVVASILVSGIISASLSPMLLPLLLIPTVGLSFKIAPKIGENLAHNIPSIKKNLFHFNNDLNQLRNQFDLKTNIAIENPVIDKKNEKTIAHKAKEILTNIELNVNKTVDSKQNNINKIEEKKQTAQGMGLKK